MKQLLTLLLFCCGICMNGFAQQNDPIPPESPKNTLTAIDEQPEYPGGTPELMRFLSANLRYPEDAGANEIEGTVQVRFIVNKNGKVKFPAVIKTLCPSCDAEVIRVVKLMPDWTPGKNKGKTVNAYFTLPVNFRLPK